MVFMAKRTELNFRRDVIMLPTPCRILVTTDQFFLSLLALHVITVVVVAERKGVLISGVKLHTSTVVVVEERKGVLISGVKLHTSMLLLLLLLRKEKVSLERCSHFRCVLRGSHCGSKKDS